MKVRDVEIEFSGKRIAMIRWKELLPITGYWSRCWDRFNPTRKSQERAARRIRVLSARACA